MAMVETAYNINVTLIDKDGNTGASTMYMDGDALFPAVEIASAAFVASINALSDASVTGYSVTKGYRENAVPAPGVGAEVERKGRFTFRLADTRTHTISIPGFRDDLVFPGGDAINGNDPAVLAFTGLVAASGTDSIGTDIIAVEKAVESYTNRRRR